MRLQCLFAALCAVCIRSEECKNENSHGTEDSSLLQTHSIRSSVHARTVLPEAEPEPEPEAEAKSHDDAQFLMRATFGPTAESLSALEGKTHHQWVQEQMALPVEPHRALYRQRINPMFVSSSAAPFGQQRSPCELGARWVRNTFSRMDINLAVEVRGSSAIYVDGVFRTDVAQGDLASEWAGMTNWTGKLCNCLEFVGGSVFLAETDCRYDFAMPNPAVLSASPVATSFSFTGINNEPDAVVVSDVFENCTLDESAIIEQFGSHYRFDKRLALQANDVGSPLEDDVACVGRNVVNEKYCKTPKHLSPPAVDGLRLEVFYATGDMAGQLRE